MSAYVIVNVDTRDPQRYEDYKAKALRQSMSATDMVIVDGCDGP